MERQQANHFSKWLNESFELPELYYPLLPIMLPRKSRELIVVSLSYLNQPLLQEHIIKTRGGICSAKVTQLLLKGEGLEWMMIYVISILLKKALNAFANIQMF